MSQPIPPNQYIPLSDFIRDILMKSNKRCTLCQLICFEDEHICPDCKGYNFEPYVEHLKNYTHGGKLINEDLI